MKTFEIDFTPSIARNIIRFSKAAKKETLFTVDDRILELSKQDVVTLEDASDLGFFFTDNDLDIVQTILDYNMRFHIFSKSVTSQHLEFCKKYKNFDKIIGVYPSFLPIEQKKPVYFSDLYDEYVCIIDALSDEFYFKNKNNLIIIETENDSEQYAYYETMNLSYNNLIYVGQVCSNLKGFGENHKYREFIFFGKIYMPYKIYNNEFGNEAWIKRLI